MEGLNPSREQQPTTEVCKRAIIPPEDASQKSGKGKRHESVRGNVKVPISISGGGLPV